MKISVEYAHIYTNTQISDEHTTSLKLLDSFKHQHSDSEISLVVMVDDYSFPDPGFDYNDFVNWLSQHDNAPDLLIRESQLIPLCDEVLAMVSDKSLKRSMTNFIKAKKYPCSLFIAAWYLARLGYITSPIIPKNITSDSLMNILPGSFKPFEDKGLAIIAVTPYAEAVGKIKYAFIEGRMIV